MSDEELRRYLIAAICTIKTQLRPDLPVDVDDVAAEFDKSLSEYDLFMEL